MPDEKRHESADLEDYEVLDSGDTLDGPPGDDPLDRGVVTPDRWSAGVRYGTTGEEQEEGESLDQLLAEEEPDVSADAEDAEDSGDEPPDQAGLDENATEDDVRRYSLDEGADPRAGRLVPEDEVSYDTDDAALAARDDLVAYDAGIDSGGATAEEAAVHEVDDDTDSGPAD
jgi:Family of unknown function (DUF5709)